MKRLMIFCILLCLSAGATAQADSLRNFKLKAVDKRGRPVRDPELLYKLARQKDFVLLDPRGVSRIDSVTHADTLLLFTRGFLGELPLAGLDSVALLVKRSRIDLPQSEMQNIGYQTIPASSNTSPVTSLKAGTDISTLGYSDLASYIQGRMAGVQVSSGPNGPEIIIRGGNNSIMLSSAALIIVDGIEYGSFAQANSNISLHEVERVDVLKEGSIYGSRGTNGVVLITTKTGRSRR